MGAKGTQQHPSAHCVKCWCHNSQHSFLGSQQQFFMSQRTLFPLGSQTAVETSSKQNDLQRPIISRSIQPSVLHKHQTTRILDILRFHTNDTKAQGGCWQHMLRHSPRPNTVSQLRSLFGLWLPASPLHRHPVLVPNSKNRENQELDISIKLKIPIFQRLQLKTKL